MTPPDRNAIRFEVFKWLQAHQGPNINEASPEEMHHFIEILTDVAVLGYTLAIHQNSK